MIHLSDLQNKGGVMATLFLAYFGGASLAGKVDVTQLLSTAISGVIAIGGWVLVAWLKHRWGKRSASADRDTTK